MHSPEEIAQVKAEIERLEKLRGECTDRGIRKRIDAWIKAEKQKLVAEHFMVGENQGVKDNQIPLVEQMVRVVMSPQHAKVFPKC